MKAGHGGGGECVVSDVIHRISAFGKKFDPHRTSFVFRWNPMMSESESKAHYTRSMAKIISAR